VVYPKRKLKKIQTRSVQYLKKDRADAASIVCAVQSCLKGKGPFSLHEPWFAGNELRYAEECIRENAVSYAAGRFASLFEEKISRYTGSPHVFLVVNGTAALHLALRLAGVEPGDEVLVPDLTFVATANAITYCQAMPHFVDCDERSLGVDPEKLETLFSGIARPTRKGCVNRKTGRTIRALLVMHTFGHPVDLDPIARLCRQYNIVLIEDAAEALGSFYKKRHVGRVGRLAVLSFNGNKVITTGGGGAVLTEDPKLAELGRHLSTTAKQPHPWSFFHDPIGYNYRMPNWNAALGCAQMEKLDFFLKQKRALAESYRRALADLSGVRFFSEPRYARSNYWLNTIVLERSDKTFRDELLKRFNACKIFARPAWTLMHKLPMYRKCPRADVSGAERLEASIINLPSSAFLGCGR